MREFYPHKMKDMSNRKFHMYAILQRVQSQINCRLFKILADQDPHSLSQFKRFVTVSSYQKYIEVYLFLSVFNKFKSDDENFGSKTVRNALLCDDRHNWQTVKT